MKEKKQRIMAMGLSVTVSTLLMALKFYTFWLTGSTAILSDALESIINVVASSFALWSILLAAKPPDVSHPYGHGKVEYFSAGFEGALIILAAGGILWHALPEIWLPEPFPNLGSGLLLLLGAGIVNLVLGWSLIAAGQTHPLGGNRSRRQAHFDRRLHVGGGASRIGPGPVHGLVLT